MLKHPSMAPRNYAPSPSLAPRNYAPSPSMAPRIRNVGQNIWQDIENISENVWENVSNLGDRIVGNVENFDHIHQDADHIGENILFGSQNNSNYVESTTDIGTEVCKKMCDFDQTYYDDIYNCLNDEQMQVQYNDDIHQEILPSNYYPIQQAPVDGNLIEPFQTSGSNTIWIILLVIIIIVIIYFVAKS